MPGMLHVAAVQMHSGADKQENIEQALELIARAASLGARFVALPEVWTYLGLMDGAWEVAEPIPGPTISRLAEAARAHDIYLHCGSVYERVEGEPRLYNTTVVLDPQGEIIAKYRKIHLFDVDIDGHVSFQESAVMAAGCELAVVEIEGVQVGLGICYDLRFPELFRLLALRGAELIVLPAAFTQFTGKDHWELLIRARAVENQLFMLAPNEWGRHPNGGVSYGRSMLVDPWGNVLAMASDGVGVINGICDLALMEKVRREVPSLANRQPAAYVWEPEPEPEPVAALR